MIIESKLIEQPYSGKYQEAIFDVESNWNSADWTYVEFIENDFSEWCGVFRGSPIGISFSKKTNKILILTSDCLYEMNSLTSKLIDYESNSEYKNLTVDEISGDFIISDDYKIEIIQLSLSNKVIIENPIEMDLIEFTSWSLNKLKIVCKELTNLDNQFYLELDINLRKINILSSEMKK